MLFSQRTGFKPVRESIQKEGIDQGLRHSLWNALHIFIFDKKDNVYTSRSELFPLFLSYWLDLFHLPLDEMPDSLGQAKAHVKAYFYSCEWFEAYDLLEFTCQHCLQHQQDNFINFCNEKLEQHVSAYRFVDTTLTTVIAENEISAIESALHATANHTGAHEHLQTALVLMSDRKSPDYRNSVKESISAVESLCVSLTGDPKATLGAAIKKIEKAHTLHPAFKNALSSLYGYTSDSGGIRHSLLEKTNIDHSEAQFMLVTCSAFISYATSKSATPPS